ncbi:hypothetical protein D9M68_947440 [compost metagenome]
MRLAFLDVGSFHVIDQWQIEHIEPDYGFVAVMAVLMPQAGRRQDQVAALHQALFAIHGGIGTFTFDNHPHCVGGMTVRRGDFTR